MSGTDERLTDFDLEEVPRQRRSKAWMDTLTSFYYDFDYRVPDDFNTGSIRGCHAGDLAIASLVSDPMTVFRTREHAARDALDAYFVMLTDGTKITLTQRGNESVIENRKFTLVSTADAYSYYQDNRTSFNNLLIPGGVMRQLAPHIDDTVANTLGDKPLERIFYDYISTLCTHFDDLDGRARDLMSRQIVDMLGLVLDGADHKSSATPIQEAHYRRITHYINQRFTDPALSIGEISAHFRLSERYVQALFKRHDTTLTKAVRVRRIEEARRLLRSLGASRSAVTQVAHSVGFNDLAYFSRVFKELTGEAPSQFTTG